MFTAQWFRCGGLRCSPLNAALAYLGNLGAKFGMNFRNHIEEVGLLVDKLRLKNRVQVKSRSDLVKLARKSSGLYWIETDMPIGELKLAIQKCSGKLKKTRKTKPDGVGFTQQVNGFQIIYAGTENDLQKRLLEHLLDEGNAGTTKMSIKIDCPLFSKYSWFVSCVYLKDYPTRYAIEAWWRLNIGWPPFCIR
ncbi:hypothetical protein AB8613_00680 [Vibrio sp. BS-M-Sm-2]